MKVISRKEAIEKNLKYFFTGKPCKRGSIEKRVVRNSDCICVACSQAIKEMKRKSQSKCRPLKGRFIHPNEESRKRALKVSRKKWQDNNKDKVKVYKDRWAKAHPEKHAEGAARRNKRWSDSNRAQNSLYAKKWRQDRKDLVNLYTINRRAKRLSATPSWFSELDSFVLSQCTELCVLRKNATGFAWSIDHMIPLQGDAVCGLHVWNNFQVIPAKMNSSKRNKLIFMEPSEWITSVEKYFQTTHA